MGLRRCRRKAMMLLAFLFAAFAFFPARGQSGQAPPSTQSILRLAPESASVSLALPPATVLFDKARMLAGRFSFPGTDLKSELEKGIALLGRASGLSETAAISNILLAQGLDPGAVSGIFLDPTPAAARARETAELVSSGAAWWKTVPVDTRKTRESDWFDLDLVNVVAVFGCSDAKLVERRAGELISALFGSKMPVDEAYGDTVIHVYEDGIAFCVAEDRFFVTNHAPMLKEALERIAKPAPVRYGSPECPAGGSDPIVLATRLDRLHALLPDLTGLLKQIAVRGQNPLGMNEALHDPVATFTSGDPCITTLDVADDKIELASWLDLAAHPQYAAHMGKTHPIRLGAFLPENCQGFASIQLTDTVRDLLRRRWIPLQTTWEGDSIEPLRAFGFLNGEAAAGIAADGKFAPRAFLLAEVSEFDALKSLLGSAAPPSPWAEDPRMPGAQFADFPPHFFLGRFDNVAILTNDRELCRTLARAVAGNKRTPILESRTPPIAPAMPIFGLFSLKTDHLGAVLSFMAGLMGAPSPETARPILDGFSESFRELRAGKIVQGNWQKVFATLYLR